MKYIGRCSLNLKIQLFKEYVLFILSWKASNECEMEARNSAEQGISTQQPNTKSCHVLLETQAQINRIVTNNTLISA